MLKIAISVIIPTYNRENTVGVAIESVLNQTQPVDEIIVVDDGSRDKTAEVVRKISADKVSYLFQNNAGVGAALNRGIKSATGNWITILDSDDCWKKEKIQKQVDLLCENRSIDFVHTNRTLCWDGGRTESREERPIEDFTNKEFLFSHWTIKQSTVLFKKELIDKTGGLFREDLRTCQDYEFFWRLILCARKIGYVAESVVDIMMSDDGLSRTDPKNTRIYDNITAMNSVIEWIERSGGGHEKYKKIMAIRIIEEVRKIIEYRLKEKSRSNILKDFIVLNKHTSRTSKLAVTNELLRKFGK